MSVNVKRSEVDYHTEAMRIVDIAILEEIEKENVTKKSDEDLKREVFAGGLHGIEHAMIGIIPFQVMCDRWDIGGVSAPNHPDTKNPTVFIYDGFEGGIGLTEKAFELIIELVTRSYELVRDCKCEDGCPACIYSPKCGNENKPLDKKTTVLILEEVLKLMKQEDKIKVGDDDGFI